MITSSPGVPSLAAMERKGKRPTTLQGKGIREPYNEKKKGNSHSHLGGVSAVTPARKEKMKPTGADCPRGGTSVIDW